jgi:hypothetical protein
MSVRLTTKRGSLENAVGTGRPRQRWNWAHFAFGFIPVAGILFFDTKMPFFSDFWSHVAETLFARAVAGTLTALSGERGFERILRMMGRS